MINIVIKQVLKLKKTFGARVGYKYVRRIQTGTRLILR